MEFGLRGSHRIVYTYVIREFLLSLLVAFIFFFFIFFINQLLLLAQKILLKNVRLSSVLKLVIFAIPQILLYTLPFSSLSASSMVIGEFTSHNEILALRACGIPLRHLYLPIMVCALILSGITFCVADIMLPVSSQSYRTIYSELLQDLPTMELDSYSVNKVGNKILVTGQVDGDTVYDLVMLDTAGQSGGTVISAARAKVVLIDIDNLMYRLDLENPVLIKTDSKSMEEFTFSSSSELSYVLDFSSQKQRMTDVTPSQMTSAQLRKQIALREQDMREDLQVLENRKRSLTNSISQNLRDMINERTGIDRLVEVIRLDDELSSLDERMMVNFYLQYYRAELHKKMALSAACFFLVFITFPLSLFRIKHGRLFGFGLSLLVACAYWFMLFFAQTQILDVSFNPGILIWAPDLIIFTIALALMGLMRRA